MVLPNGMNPIFPSDMRLAIFYSGTKALAEEAIRGVGQSYIWRPRMPFNERDETRNLLSETPALRQGL